MEFTHKSRETNAGPIAIHNDVHHVVITQTRLKYREQNA